MTTALFPAWLSPRWRRAVAAGPYSPAAFRDARIDLGETQASLARLLGVDEQTVSRWEHGRSGMNVTACIIVRLLLDEARP